MTSERQRGDSPAFRDYVRTLRRQRRVIAVVVLLALAVGVYHLSVTPLYQASSEVLLSRDSAAATLTHASSSDTRGDPERFVQTQLQVAQSESLARRVLATVGPPNLKPTDLLGMTQVVAPAGADVLKFRVQDSSPRIAARLANEYAAQFASYQGDLDQAALNRALAQVRARIDRLIKQRPAEAGRGSGLYTTLVQREKELQALEPLQTGKAVVLSSSGPPVKVRPNPKRDLLVALFAGLLLGTILAFVVEALERRVDSIGGIAQELGFPLLGWIPSQRRLRRPEHLSLVAGPDGRQFEAFQALRANLETELGLAGLDAHRSAVMVTSAGRREGKSTTVANLGVALALAGHQVILVDLDPEAALGRCFGVPDGGGVVDVAKGTTGLDEALVELAVSSAHLTLLPFGGRAKDFSGVATTDALASILEDLRSRADVVLIDAAPLLKEGTSSQVATFADAVVVVVRADDAPERVLRRVRSILARSRAVTLGFVATGAPDEAFAGEELGDEPTPTSDGPTPARGLGSDGLHGDTERIDELLWRDRHP